MREDHLFLYHFVITKGGHRPKIQYTIVFEKHTSCMRKISCLTNKTASRDHLLTMKFESSMFQREMGLFLTLQYALMYIHVLRYFDYHVKLPFH